MGQADGARRLCLEMEGVRVWTPEGADLLRDITWRVRAGEHWALLGPNGAGKSTLLSLAGARRHPSAGSVRVLGERLGKVDMRELRRLIGVVDPVLRMPDELSAETVVLTGASGSVQPLWSRPGGPGGSRARPEPGHRAAEQSRALDPRWYGAAERARARELLELVGCAHLARRRVGTCSQGERGRIRIARALMPSPRLLLLDEPASGLDLAAREQLLSALSDLAAFQPELAAVVVSHHLEDLPPGTSHAMLLAGGAIVASGPVERALTDQTVSACFGLPVHLRRHGGRWAAVGGHDAGAMASPPAPAR